MKTSDSLAKFQFIGSAIQNLNISNSFVLLNVNENTTKTFDVDYEINEINLDSEDNNSYFGVLDLIVTVDVSNEKQNLNISLKLQGCFHIENSTTEEFSEMLELNGASVLYSAARSIITSVTAQICYGEHLILPMINILKLREEKYSDKKEEDPKCSNE